jgi:hypothetical protein
MLDDSELQHLEKYQDTLRTLKIANNKIKSLETLISFISKMKSLVTLDLSDNAVVKEDDYREKVMEALKKNCLDEEERIVLDCKDEEGISVSDFSEDDEDEEEGEFDMGEEGEFDLMNDFDMDSETKKKIQDGTITKEELAALNVNISDGGEEGELEDYDDEEGRDLEKKPKQNE